MRLRSSRRSMALAAGVLATLTWDASSQGAVVVSTINDETSELVPPFYEQGSYVSGAASFPGQVSYVADAFELEADAVGEQGATLTKVRAALSLFDGTNGVTLAIMSSIEEDGLPDQILKSVTLAGVMSDYVAPGLVEADFAAGAPLVLEAEERYWLAAFPAQSDTAAIWHLNYDPDVIYNAEYDWYDLVDDWRTGVVAWHNGVLWQYAEPTESAPTQPPNHALHAFEITVEPVPEPATGLAALVTLAYLGRIRRRTR